LAETTNTIQGLLDGKGMWCVDTPIEAFSSAACVIDLRGWIALPSEVHDRQGPFLQRRGEAILVNQVARPDVESELPDMAIIGFDDVIDVALLEESGSSMTVVVDGNDQTLRLPTVIGARALALSFLDRKARMLERLYPILACPVCRCALRDGSDGSLTCPSNHTRGQRLDYRYELLPVGQEPAELIPPFSAHPYDTEPRVMIEELSGGLILDDGCGLRYQCFENVANLDISPFPTTDVVATCEQLPFKDASFDGVISVAVLEHVVDPQLCVEQIARVLKPGGSVYVAVPFLQPYHGYPHHYFNMTRDGLRTLFAPFFEVDDIITPYGGLPIRTLTWFLDRYLQGLPAEVRKDFSTRTVGELAGDPEPHLGQDYVTELDTQAIAELASVNVLLGRRRKDH
jgi:SAM-dependent methyltransferase